MGGGQLVDDGGDWWRWEDEIEDEIVEVRWWEDKMRGEVVVRWGGMIRL